MNGSRLLRALGAALALVLALGTLTATSSPVSAEPLPPLEVTEPRLHGLAKVGKALRVIVKASGSPKPELSYQWLRKGKPIPGATGVRYEIVAADRGQRLAVRVTAVSEGHETLVQISKPSEVVQAGTFRMAKPRLVGSARVGGVLKAKVRLPGEVKPALRYAWYRNGKRIASAKQSSYRLTSKDQGRRITVKVTGSKAGYAKQTKSQRSAKIKPKRINDPRSIQVVVNKLRPLSPKRYVPRGLVMPSGIENTNGQPVRKVTAKALKKMRAAARKDGIDFRILSGYRSYGLQQSLYNGYVARDGRTTADLYSARPGHSEHQTGLAVDLGGWDGCGLGTCFGGTATGKWLAKNSYKYGFILRYPKGYTHITGYAYEPWHFRYVGTQTAKKMKREKIRTLEQYHGLRAARDYR